MDKTTIYLPRLLRFKSDLIIKVQEPNTVQKTKYVARRHAGAILFSLPGKQVSSQDMWPRTHTRTVLFTDMASVYKPVSPLEC